MRHSIFLMNQYFFPFYEIKPNALRLDYVNKQMHAYEILYFRRS